MIKGVFQLVAWSCIAGFKVKIPAIFLLGLFSWFHVRFQLALFFFVVLDSDCVSYKLSCGLLVCSLAFSVATTAAIWFLSLFLCLSTLFPYFPRYGLLLFSLFSPNVPPFHPIIPFLPNIWLVFFCFECLHERIREQTCPTKCTRLSCTTNHIFENTKRVGFQCHCRCKIFSLANSFTHTGLWCSHNIKCYTLIR